MQSLLGQFYNRIKGSQEDIASESLAYILKNSEKARKAINLIVKTKTDLDFADLSFQAQVVGEKQERPDISGIDSNGDEVLLLEAKFWSSLTKNQPNEYLKRLNKNTILIFVVPSLRIRSIYDEVLKKIINEYKLNIEPNSEEYTIKIINENKYILIKSWREILNIIKMELIQENNQTLISDIDQIIGFCETIDKNTFQPITESDLSPDIPKKINSYYDIVDKVVDLLKNTMQASTKGLQSTPQRYGYCKYFELGNYGLGLSVKMDLWAVYADTPFWLSISYKKESGNWYQSDKAKKECERAAINLKTKYVEEKGIYIAIEPLKEVTEDKLIKDLAEKVNKICRELDKENKT